MKKIHPEYLEPINENIFNFLEKISKEIKQNSSKDPNEVVKISIERFYNNTKKINASFPKSILDFIKSNIIETNIESFDESLKNLNASTKENLKLCCIEFFIQKYHSYEKILVDEEEYIEYSYPYLLKCLEKFRLSNSGKVEIEKWLEKSLDQWENFNRIWQDFKKKNIESVEFLKQSFDTYGQIPFINKLFKNPTIDQCVNSKRKQHKNEIIKKLNNDEREKLHESLVRKLTKRE